MPLSLHDYLLEVRAFHYFRLVNLFSRFTTTLKTNTVHCITKKSPRTTNLIDGQSSGADSVRADLIRMGTDGSPKGPSISINHKEHNNNTMGL